MYIHNFVSESKTIIWMPTAEFIFLISMFSAIILFCVVVVIIVLKKNKSKNKTYSDSRESNKDSNILTVPYPKEEYCSASTPNN